MAKQLGPRLSRREEAQVQAQGGGQYAASAGMQRAYEALASAEANADDLHMWVSYLHGMRKQVLSPLLWGKFEKFMESRGLELRDVSFEDLP